MEDVLFPSLRLSTHERALYVHLLRHSRVEGRRTMRTSKAQLSRGVGVCPTTVRHYLRSLARTPCVEILERGERGFLLEVRLPAEIAEITERNAALKGGATGVPLAEIAGVTCAQEKRRRDPSGRPKALALRMTTHVTKEEAEARGRRNEFKNRKVRRAIFRREKGRCFYCGKKLREGGWGLDHVVPLALGGDNSSGNAVACCHECNCAKGETRAEDFLRALRRQGRLTSTEWRERVRILQNGFATEARRDKDYGRGTGRPSSTSVSI